ncbi:MAG TPA: penicillin-binding transpeptidase domain-containing protein, partial [Bacillota bacterium]|nr:penicillin-binding transpeptidase domain-containing protein [Bacillota bacterium]
TNPNDPFTSSTKQRWLTPITDSYEPGSTFKLVVAAAAIEEGLADLDDKFYDPGHIKVANATIRCWKAGGHGEQTLAEAMANSCNPVFSSLALKLGPEKFMHYVTAFGFGSKTGVDFPGEATGLLHSLKQFRVVEQATYAFGQGLSVTGLQLVSALSTIANGGTLMRPYLVKELRDLSGTLVKRTLPAKIRKVLSDATVAKVQKMLHDVTTIGSGTKAVPAGYKVAGKTGTAQKPEGGGYGDKRISSFMGYLPADDPKVAILVAIDEPSTENRYGGTVAAPVFQRIASDIMRYMEVAPSEQVKASEKVAQLTKVPDVIGTERARAAALLRSAGLVMAAEGEGTVATEMVPRPGTSATKGSAVMVYFAEQGTKQEKEGLESVVPDLRGKSLKSAAIAAGLSGFALSPEGSGIVYKQSPAPGGRYLKGTLIAVWLRTQ